MLDIESTLRHVCNKVLSDTSTEMGERQARARALVLMGRVFKAYGSAGAIKKMDFASHVESVGQRLAEEAHAENAQYED